MNVGEVIKTARSSSLESRTIIHLVLVGHKVQKALAYELKPFRVSPEQFNVLRILRGQGEKPVNPGTINEYMITRMSNTTRLVDKLVKKGFVGRRTCPSNRRKVEIWLTEEGRIALLEMDQAVKHAQDEILAELTEDEIITLNTLIDKI